MRVLVTDGSMKHAIGLARHIKMAMPEHTIIAHDPDKIYYSKFYKCYDERILGGDLGAVLRSDRYDFAVCVSSRTIPIAIQCCPERAILPAAETHLLTLDKQRTMEVAHSVGVRVPVSQSVGRVEEIDLSLVTYPCVLKAIGENGPKDVLYLHNEADLLSSAANLIEKAAKYGQDRILVQEFIEGIGTALFALCVKGKVKRIFMHERIREFPVTGGPSTAAKAIYNTKLRDAGVRLLEHLNWNGVAMVEFKRRGEDEFVLMEINGKFWGSTELALAAGVNFGADLIRVFQGEDLKYSEEYDRDCKFYWPLDGDIRSLVKRKELGKMSDYWKPGAHHNLFISTRADILKSAILVKQLAGL